MMLEWKRCLITDIKDKGYLLIEMAPPQNEATLKEDLTRA